MLALFLILACAPTDPVEACVRTYEAACDCGYPYQSCAREDIDRQCAVEYESYVDVNEYVAITNCVFEEYQDCPGSDWDATRAAATAACDPVGDE